MRKLSLPALVALSIVAVASFFVHSSNQPLFAANNTTIATVIEHDTTVKTFLPTNAKKDNPIGTYTTYTNPLYDAGNKKKIGTSVGTCINLSRAAYHCHWTMIFSHGTIEIAGGAVKEQKHTLYAVTGGTGVYRNIKGEADLELMHDHATTLYKYTFMVD